MKLLRRIRKCFARKELSKRNTSSKKKFKTELYNEYNEHSKSTVELTGKLQDRLYGVIQHDSDEECEKYKKLATKRRNEGNRNNQSVSAQMSNKNKKENDTGSVLKIDNKEQLSCQNDTYPDYSLSCQHSVDVHAVQVRNENANPTCLNDMSRDSEEFCISGQMYHEHFKHLWHKISHLNFIDDNVRPFLLNYCCPEQELSIRCENLPLEIPGSCYSCKNTVASQSASVDGPQSLLAISYPNSDIGISVTDSFSYDENELHSTLIDNSLQKDDIYDEGYETVEPDANTQSLKGECVMGTLDISSSNNSLNNISLEEIITDWTATVSLQLSESLEFASFANDRYIDIHDDSLTDNSKKDDNKLDQSQEEVNSKQKGNHIDIKSEQILEEVDSKQKGNHVDIKSGQIQEEVDSKQKINNGGNKLDHIQQDDVKQKGNQEKINGDGLEMRREYQQQANKIDSVESNGLINLEASLAISNGMSNVEHFSVKYQDGLDESFKLRGEQIFSKSTEKSNPDDASKNSCMDTNVISGTGLNKEQNKNNEENQDMERVVIVKEIDVINVSQNDLHQEINSADCELEECFSQPHQTLISPKQGTGKHVLGNDLEELSDNVCYVICEEKVQHSDHESSEIRRTVDVKYTVEIEDKLDDIPLEKQASEYKTNDTEIGFLNGTHCYTDDSERCVQRKLSHIDQKLWMELKQFDDSVKKLDKDKKKKQMQQGQRNEENFKGYKGESKSDQFVVLEINTEHQQWENILIPGENNTIIGLNPSLIISNVNVSKIEGILDERQEKLDESFKQKRKNVLSKSVENENKKQKDVLDYSSIDKDILIDIDMNKNQRKCNNINQGMEITIAAASVSKHALTQDKKTTVCDVEILFSQLLHILVGQKHGIYKLFVENYLKNLNMDICHNFCEGQVQNIDCGLSIIRKILDQENVSLLDVKYVVEIEDKLDGIPLDKHEKQAIEYRNNGKVTGFVDGTHCHTIDSEHSIKRKLGYLDQKLWIEITEFENSFPFRMEDRLNGNMLKERGFRDESCLIRDEIVSVHWISSTSLLDTLQRKVIDLKNNHQPRINEWIDIIAESKMHDDDKIYQLEVARPEKILHCNQYCCEALITPAQFMNDNFAVSSKLHLYKEDYFSKVFTICSKLNKKKKELEEVFCKVFHTDNLDHERRTVKLGKCHSAVFESIVEHPVNLSCTFAYTCSLDTRHEGQYQPQCLQLSYWWQLVVLQFCTTGKHDKTVLQINGQNLTLLLQNISFMVFYSVVSYMNIERLHHSGITNLRNYCQNMLELYCGYIAGILPLDDIGFLFTRLNKNLLLNESFYLLKWVKATFDQPLFIGIDLQDLLLLTLQFKICPPALNKNIITGLVNVFLNKGALTMDGHYFRNYLLPVLGLFQLSKSYIEFERLKNSLPKKMEWLGFSIVDSQCLEERRKHESYASALGVAVVHDGYLKSPEKYVDSSPEHHCVWNPMTYSIAGLLDENVMTALSGINLKTTKAEILVFGGEYDYRRKERIISIPVLPIIEEIVCDESVGKIKVKKTFKARIQLSRGIEKEMTNHQPNEASSRSTVDIRCISDFDHLDKPTGNSLKVIRDAFVNCNESTCSPECRSSTDTLTSEETKKYEERVVKTLQLVDVYVEDNGVGRISYFRNQTVENGYSSRLYNPSVVDRKIRLKKLLLKYQKTTDKVEKVHVNDLKHRLGKKARLNTPLRELLAHFFKTCKRPILSKTGRDLVAEIQETYKKLPESVKTVIAYPVARQGNQAGQNTNEQETGSAGSSAQVAESTSDETGSNQQEFRAQLEGLSLYFHEMQQEPMPTLRESMRHEWMRLKTFWSFPLNIGVSPFKLAKWGFYYTGHCGETKCFSCARIYKDWEDGDDPMSVHRRISPSCPFLLGTDIRNEPITRPSLPSVTPGGQLAGPLQSQDPSSTENSTGAMSVTQEQAITNVTTTPGSNIDNSNFAFVGTPTLVENRILFTASTNQEKNIDVTSPLQAGSNATETSVSTASTPNVVSTSTSETITTGVPGTSPGTVMSTGFMATSSMPGNKTTTSPVTATASSLASVVSSTSTTLSGTPVSAATRSSSGNVGSIHIAVTTTASNLVSSTNQAARTAPRTTSGPSTPSTSQPAATTSTRTGTTSSRSSSSNTTASTATHERYDPLGINFDRPRYPAYAVIANRSASFDQWPGYLRSPHEMAVAGFFYAGYGDYVRCFFCGGGLRNWEDEDDPWVEHTKWFPKCAFVKQNKGEQFIEKVLKRQEEIDKQRTHGTATITHEVDEATQGATAAPEITEMATSAVKAIKEMGYSEEPIQRALDIFHRRQEQAPQELTATALMHIILDDFDNSATVTTDAIPKASGGVDATSATGTVVTSPSSASSTEMALKITASGGETEIVEVKSSESPNSKDRKPKSAKGKSNRKKKKEQTPGPMQPKEPGADDEINEEDSDMESLQAENVQLKSQLLCKVCAEQEVSMAFLPCGHLVCCGECGPAMRKCPICKGTVKGTVKTFFP